MARTRSFLLAFGLLALLHGCGDDDASSDDDDGGAPDDTSTQPDSGSPSEDAGGADTGADQGEACSEDSDCKGSLGCIPGPPGLPSHCGRACTDDSECIEDLNEQCISYTGAAPGLHCVTITDVPFSACSLEDNIACAPPMSCLPPGVCIEICQFGDDGDAGVDADAGVDRGTCSRETDECLEGVLTNDQFGACATFIERGEPCGGEAGLCGLEDLCAPDPLQPLAQDRCTQRCGEPGVECDEGTTCVLIGTYEDGTPANACQ